MLCVNMSKTSMLESMVKQKCVQIKGFQLRLVTIKEDGSEKIILPETNICLLGVNLEQNLSWNSHLLTVKKSLLPALRKQEL